MKLLSPVTESTTHVIRIDSLTKIHVVLWKKIPRGTVEKNFQRRLSTNVWCCMIDDMLIGVIILDDRMTGQNYLDFLQN